EMLIQQYRRKLRVNRNVDIRRLRRIDAKKLRRRDAYDSKRRIVQRDRSADGFRWIPETFLAVGEAQHRYRGRSGPVVVIHDQAPCCRRNTEAPEVIAGNTFAGR